MVLRLTLRQNAVMGRHPKPLLSNFGKIQIFEYLRQSLNSSIFHQSSAPLGLISAPLSEDNRTQKLVCTRSVMEIKRQNLSNTLLINQILELIQVILSFGFKFINRQSLPSIYSKI